jgi:uncharacterized protein YndB with AHSA1/START domain/DNA-binding transcriptional ArsR family regulator
VQPLLLAALAEPNRLRIVELLAAAPRPVGEIADVLALRQPQVTKHLQTLERAGLVTVHPLGKRRIYALRRGPLRDLAAWLGGFTADDPDEHALTDYQRRIATEQDRLAAGRTRRTFRLARRIPAAPSRVWRAWTAADAVRRWWHPRHFAVAECTVEPVPRGRLRIVLREGDGTRHVAEGRFRTLREPSVLSFELAPLDPSGQPLFSAVHRLSLQPSGRRTELALVIRVSGVRPEAAPAVAGMEPGWEQLLDHLTEHLRSR